MALKFKTENKPDYFLVTSKGKNNDLSTISNYAAEVIKYCKESNHQSLIIDERNREYNLDELLDQYKLANYFKTLDLSNIRIAIICKPQYIEKINFIETTANNRGINLKYVLDLESAERWVQ